MPYIDASGNVVEKKESFLAYILSFFNFIVLFFKSLFGLDGPSNAQSADDRRDHLRRGGGGGGPAYPGPGNGPTTRRQIGRLPRSSGMSCPPMAGGG